MAVWMEAIGCLVLVLGTAHLAYRFGCGSHRRAVTTCVLSIGILSFILTLHILHIRRLYSGMDWIACSRLKFVLLGVAIPIGLCGPMGRLAQPWKRILVLTLTGGYLTAYIGLPFFAPAVMQHRIRSTPTLITARGVCLQSTDYTCGPAAAVTALKQLGLMIPEGQIAADSRTAPLIGTCPWQLYKALDKICSPHGIRCRYQSVNSLNDLPSDAVTLAILKQGFLIDHCVAILQVTDSTVLYADPSIGLRSVPRQTFEFQWRQNTITLQPAGRTFAAKP